MNKKRSVCMGFVEKLRDNKRLETAVYAGLILVVVIIFVSTGGISCPFYAGKENAEKDLTGGASSADGGDLEKKLEEILSSISGVGKVSVMITFEKGDAIVPAVESQTSFSEDGSSESRSSVTVSQSGNQSPIALAGPYPSIRGVIVVAEGASDIRVRSELMNAVMTVLETEASRISIFKMRQ